MFEVLFISPKALARHQAGPAAVDRERYLAHCAGQGAARGTLLRIARELLVIAERVDVTVGKSVTRSEIEAAARAWARQQKRRCRTGSEQWSRRLFAQMAAAWLRFLGILKNPPHSERNTFFSGNVDEYIAHLRDERGLSPNTVGSRRWQVEGFLDHVSSSKASIASITVADIDTFLESKGRENWCRVSVASCATALRSFFRYAEKRQWCSPEISRGATPWPSPLEIVQDCDAHRLHDWVVLCLPLLEAFDRDDFSVPIQILETQSPDFTTSQPMDGKQHQNCVVAYIARFASAGAVDEPLDVGPARTSGEPFLFEQAWRVDGRCDCL